MLTLTLAILSFFAQAYVPPAGAKPVVIINSGSVQGGGSGTGPALLNPNVTQVSPTQAIVDVDWAAITSQCISARNCPAFGTEVSEKADYSVPVNDVNPALFAGSNLSSRPLTILSPGHVKMIIGKRSAELDANGISRSRALANNTTEYFRLTAPGRSPLTFNATTMIQPYGTTYMEPQMPYQFGVKPGAIAFPALNHNGRDGVIDPQTGYRLNLTQILTDLQIGHYNENLDVGTGSYPGWTGLSNINSGSGYATVSTSQPLFLHMGNTGHAANQVYDEEVAYGGRDARPEFGSYKSTITVHSSATSTAKACIATNGVSCDPRSLIKSCPAGSTDAACVFGTSIAKKYDLWQNGDFGSNPPSYEQANKFGHLHCSNSPAVTNNDGDPYGAATYFAPNWVHGSNITVNGVAFLIDQVVDGNHMTLQSSCPTGDYAYESDNFGILIWRDGNGTDTLSVKSAAVDYYLYTSGKGPTGGGSPAVNQTTVIGPGGEVGRLVQLSAATYFVGSITGQTHFLGMWQGTDRSTNLLGCPAFGTGFDLTGNSVICDELNNKGGPLSQIDQWTYHGDYSDIPWTSGPGDGLDYHQCPGNTSTPDPSSQPCFSKQVTVPNGVLLGLVQTFTANDPHPFDPAQFPNVLLLGVDAQGIYTFTAQFSSYLNGKEFQYTIVYDPNAQSNGDGGSYTGTAGNHGCVGGGAKGCIIAAAADWLLQNNYWCISKNSIPAGAGAVELFTYFGAPPGQNGPDPNATPPVFSTMIDATADGGVNTISNNPATFQACPSNPYGATGNNCITITVDGQPNSKQAASKQLGPWRSGNLAYFGDGWNRGPDETVLIVSVGPSASTTAGALKVVLQRGWDSRGYHSSASTGLQAGCSVFGTHSSGYSIWSWKDDPHGTLDYGKSWQASTGSIISPYETGDHLSTTLSGDFAWYQVDDPVRAAGKSAIGQFGYIVGTRSLFPDYASYFKSGNWSYYADNVMFNNSPCVNGYDPGAVASHVGIYTTPAASTAYKNTYAAVFDGRPSKGEQETGTTPGGNAVRQSGDLWMIPVGASPHLERPFQFSYPTAAFAGDRTLADVSGPNSIIDGTPKYAFKWCSAAANNECVQGSLAGQIYVNIPVLTFPYAFTVGQNWTGPRMGTQARDISISGAPFFRDRNTQTKIDFIGDSTSSSITRGLSNATGTRYTSPYFSSEGVCPDLTCLFFETNFPGDASIGRGTFMLTLNPKFDDGKVRAGFQPIPVAIPQTANALAGVEFGYAENDGFGNPDSPTNDQLSCTTRQEHCVASGTSTNWAATSPTQASCYDAGGTVTSYGAPAQMRSNMALTDVNGTGKIVQVPGIPGRVMYYRQIFQDKTSLAFTYGPLFAVAVP